MMSKKLNVLVYRISETLVNLKEWFCLHKWKMMDLMEKCSVAKGTNDVRVRSKVYVQKCIKCGKLRHYEVKA